MLKHTKIFVSKSCWKFQLKKVTINFYNPNFNFKKLPKFSTTGNKIFKSYQKSPYKVIKNLNLNKLPKISTLSKLPKTFVVKKLKLKSYQKSQH
jgi:hypothetical protein